MRIALVTWRGLPALASDDQVLQTALRSRGAVAEAVVWDDGAVDFAAYDAVVLRSTWDYHLRPNEFRRWLDSLEAGGAVVWNPVRLLRWNMHKSYLLELAARGVPVVPTVLLRCGEQRAAREVMAANGWSRAVVKPAVSATAYETIVTDGTGEQRATDRDLLVQPFVEEIVQAGEWSLVFFDGRYSHATLKQAARGDFRVQSDFGGTVQRVDPEPELIDQAAAILATLSEPWLYARVDGVVVDGRFLLMELEMTEPSLFLDQRSATVFAEAVISSTRRRTRSSRRPSSGTSSP